MSHISDSRFYGDGFCTPEMRAHFSDEARFQRWLDVEAALALVQGELGVIPREAAHEIAGKARLENVDLEVVRRQIAYTSHSLVPLLREVQGACRDGLGEFIHFGATTQDIQDTGSVLEMRGAFDLLRGDLTAILELLIDLAERHEGTLMAAKTHGQHALVTTFGYRVAINLRELARHMTRMREASRRLFRVSLFGGVGNMTSLPRGVETMQGLAARLRLEPADVSWHTSRDCIAEFVSLMAMICSTLGKIGNEVFVLARTECGELAEGHVAGRLGSSTMPHKRNPEVSQRIVLLARLTKYQAAMALEAMIAEDDRDMRSFRADWVSIPDVCSYTAAAARLTKQMLVNLDVRADRMEQNLLLQRDFVFSEALMFKLGEAVGKQTAHQIVYEASMRAYDRGEPITDHLLQDPKVHAHLDRATVEELLVTSAHVGAAAELTRSAVEQSRRELAELASWSP